jgi:hypothetical protein
MDVLPLDMSCPLPDYLRQQAQRLHKQRAREAKSRSKRGSASSGSHDGPRNLALTDQIYFRILPPPSVPDAQVKVVEDTFRTAFIDVWSHLPPCDRRLLRAYWHNQPNIVGHDDLRPWSSSRPQIRVVDGDSWSPSFQVCNELGSRLNFPFSLVVEQPALLPFVIARALAEVSRYASRRHWALIQELIEEPLARWERRQGKRIDDARRDAKLDRLERAHQQAYEKEIAAILDGWGLGQARSCEGS